MKEIYIIRHGQTDYNKQFIVQGSGVDSSLNSEGLAQAASFYNFYKNEGFEKVFCSTLKRTYQTVESFIKDGIPFEKHADINEMNWGIHEGKKSEPWMHQSYKDLIAAWKNDDIDARIPEGESARELIARIQNFIETLRQIPEQKVLVCTHGRAMRCLIACLKNEAHQQMETYSHANTGLYLTQFDNDTFKLILENDIRHLKQAK